MARAHLVRPVLDEEGRLVTNINVRLLDPDTSMPITEAVYLSALGDDVAEQPINFLSGVIDVYLDEPRRVRLGVTKGTQAEVFFEDIDILSAEDVGNTTTLGGAPIAVAGRKSGDSHYDITDPESPVGYVLFGDPLEWVQTGGSDFLTEEDANTLFLTQAEGDARYAPLVPEDEVGTPDPETGGDDTLGTTFSLQTVVAGDLAVSPNIVKPGLRVVKAGSAHTVIMRVDTVPTGGPIQIAVRRYNGGVLADTITTVTISAGVSVGVVTDLDHPCAKGDILKFEVLAVGTTVPGADINMSVDFK